jgi:hypothetical protein
LINAVKYPSSQQETKMGREDQTEEREVLDSIFPDEITGTTAIEILCQRLAGC